MTWPSSIIWSLEFLARVFELNIHKAVATSSLANQSQLPKRPQPAHCHRPFTTQSVLYSTSIYATHPNHFSLFQCLNRTSSSRAAPLRGTNIDVIDHEQLSRALSFKMQFLPFLYPAFLTLLMLAPDAAQATKKNPKDAILLSNVRFSFPLPLSSNPLLDNPATPPLFNPI